MAYKFLRGPFHYKGFRIKLWYSDSYLVVDAFNDKQWLNGRTNEVTKEPFGFPTLLSAKEGVDRYQKLRPDDPSFASPWRNTLPEFRCDSSS